MLPHPRRLILASGSRYRRAQLAALGIACEAIAPDIDETRRLDEAPDALAQRLALHKAGVIARLHPEALVIGADQVAATATQIYGKPGSAERQRAQLAECAGQTLVFHTAVALCCAATGLAQVHLDQTRCRMRALSAADIEAYVRAEPAIDCAGGFKVEGRGILLFEAIESEDPSALIGLPLIALGRMLRAAQAL